MSKTIIITGASSGIGFALSEFLARQGHQVIAIGRNEAQLETLKMLSPDNIQIVVADLTIPEDRNKILPLLKENEEGVYLVHNAGVAVPNLISNLSEQEFDNHYLVNVKAPLFLTKLLIPYLKNGRILHVSTGLARNSLAGFSAYGTTKAAFYMLKEFCNVELKNQMTICGSAMPGIVDTPIQAGLRSSNNPEIASLEMFRGFKQRDELLTPLTAAKFLAWLLIESNDEAYKNSDWDIYDESHHSNWAVAGDIKPRTKPN